MDVTPGFSLDRLRKSTAMAFPTPIVAYRWPTSEALNDDLRRVVLAKERDDQGRRVSNVGGWHSQHDLITWDHDCVRTLVARMSTLSIALTKVAADVAQRKVSARTEIPITTIGQLVAGTPGDVRVEGPDGVGLEFPASGWRHF